MRKYIEVLKLQFKMELGFRLDIAFTMLFTVIRILFATIVWPAVFEGQTEIAGFTLQTMLSFYVASSFIAGLDVSEGISWEVSNRIRQGTFSKFLIIPAKPETYFQFQSFGVTFLHMWFDLIATALWVIAFRIPLVVTANAAALLSAAGLTILGLVFLNQLNFFIGILAFRFLDVSTFLMVKNNLIAFLTGSMIPLALLPAWAQSAMRIFPFYYVNNLPAMLIIGRSENEIPMGFLVMGAWIAALFAVNQFSFAALRKRFDGVGV